MSQDIGLYMLNVDASDFAVGAVLQQEQGGELRVIGYASRAFNSCERKYCIICKELAAMIFGLKQYHQYLLGRHFRICSDHAALTYLRSAKELVGQQARWLDFIEEFTFKLQHRAGIAHENADALSRKYTPEDLPSQGRSQCRRRRFVYSDVQDGELVDPERCQDHSGPVFAVNNLTAVFTGNIDGLRLYGDRPLGDITKYRVSY